MAVTLAQAALLSQNDLQRGVIETFVQESAVLDRLPLMEIQGNAYAYNKEATLPGVAFRSVNEAYTESTGTVVQATESLVILGGDADVDTFIQRTRSDLNDQRAIQTRLKVKAASYKFQDAFFNGDVAVDPKGFDGLKKRLTGAQVIDAGTNGLPIVGASNADIFSFMDKLDELIAAVPGITAENGAIYAPRSLRSKIISAGRRVGGTEMVREDLTGKRIATWNGIPLLDAGDSLAGTPILANNETQGSSNVAGSIYAVRFGEDETDGAVTGLTNGGVDVRDLGEVDDKPAYRTRIEFFCGLATFGGKSAARLRGVLNG
jgi:hypothetical protein